MAVSLSASSRRLRSRQYGAAYLVEGAQRIDRMTVHQLCDSENVLFGAKYVSIIVRTTTSALSTSERDKHRIQFLLRLDTDQRRNLRLVPHEGVGVELRYLIDELSWPR
jgi:hypothetical protein